MLIDVLHCRARSTSNRPIAFFQSTRWTARCWRWNGTVCYTWTQCCHSVSVPPQSSLMPWPTPWTGAYGTGVSNTCSILGRFYCHRPSQLHRVCRGHGNPGPDVLPVLRPDCGPQAGRAHKLPDLSRHRDRHRPWSATLATGKASPPSNSFSGMG